MTDFHALCVDLARVADALDGRTPLTSNQGQALDGYSALAEFRHVADRARAALAAEADGPAVPEGREPASVTGQPTDKEPTRLRNCPTHGQQPPWAWGCPECVRQLREELAALQQRHPEPVPVSERLPGPEDCDAEGRCWFLRFPFDYSRESWSLEDRTYGCNTGFTHWLPAHSLPLPEVNNG